MKLHSRFELDIESGAIFSGYNDVRITGAEGTKFSLKDDLKTEPEMFIRARIYYHFNQKHHLSILYAPLTIEANGKVKKNIVFQNETFPSNTNLTSIYRFNSYRLTYRYDFIRKSALTFGMGFTAKIRDAIISLESADLKEEKKNVGFVPIINFRLNWMFSKLLFLIVEGDALAAPQGRAEDVAMSLNYHINKKLNLRFGYRVLEGGADNDEVYTFSLFHYIGFGLNYNF